MCVNEREGVGMCLGVGLNVSEGVGGGVSVLGLLVGHGDCSYIKKWKSPEGI